MNGNCLFRCYARCLGELRGKVGAASRDGFLMGGSLRTILILVIVSLLSGFPEDEFLPIDQSAFLQGRIRSVRLSLSGASFV